MISSLTGTVLSIRETAAVIDVGGVGFAVSITPAHAQSLRVGKVATLITTLIVREDALVLYGFADQQQQDAFELLCGVSGVGPKSAMGVLAVLSPGEMARAVARDDDTVFKKVSGIGPKTAKLIIVSLSGKLPSFVSDDDQAPAIESSVRGDVLQALVGLGWQEKTADEVVRRLIADDPELADGDVPTVLRRALSHLGPRATKE